MINKIFYSLVLFPYIKYQKKLKSWFSLIKIREKKMWEIECIFLKNNKKSYIIFTHLNFIKEKKYFITKNWKLTSSNNLLLEEVFEIIKLSDKYDFNFFNLNNTKIPFWTVLNITSKCNLFCNYCFNDYDYPLDTRNERDTLWLEHFKKIIDELYSAWTRDIILTWWEPFSCTFLWELLDYLREKNIFIRINTNWTLLFDNILDRLDENYSIHLMVSMHEFNNKDYFDINKKWALNIYGIENLFKWETKYDKKVKQLKKIKDYRNLTLDFLTILTPINILYLEDIYRYILSNFEIEDWHFFRLFSTWTTKWISREMITLAIHKIFKLNNMYNRQFKIVDSVPFCVTKNIDLASKVIDWELSDTHNVKTIITAEWNIQIMSAFDMNLWSIFEKWIKKVWEWDFVQKKLTNWFLPKECYNCLYKNKCMWWSRMDANIFNWSYSALDPLCNIKNKITI